MSDNSDNPFKAGPHVLIPQEVKICGMCGSSFTNRSYTVTVLYEDEKKVASRVCPDCMKRLGFSEPKITVPERKYMELLEETGRLYKKPNWRKNNGSR